MTRDEITRMAREAGFVGMDGLHKGLCRFAALVAAAEREACAKACQGVVDGGSTTVGSSMQRQHAAMKSAPVARKANHEMETCAG